MSCPAGPCGCAARSRAHHTMMVATLPVPETGKLGRDQFAVPDLPFQGADLTSEWADMRDHLLADGRVVEGSIPRHLVGDETRLLGWKQALRGLRGQLRVGPERPLSFHDGPHGPCSDVRMLLDQPLRGRERREGPVAGRGRAAASPRAGRGVWGAPLLPPGRPPAAGPVAVCEAPRAGVSSTPAPVWAGGP